jgi:hypothetical protein
VYMGRTVHAWFPNSSHAVDGRIAIQSHAVAQATELSVGCLHRARVGGRAAAGDPLFQSAARVLARVTRSFRFATRVLARVTRSPKPVVRSQGRVTRSISVLRIRAGRVTRPSRPSQAF